MRLKATATVPSVDLDALIASVPFLLDGWRALVVDGTGVVLDDGTRAEGLSVASGAHPLPGVTYRVVMPGQLAPEVTREDSAELQRRLQGRSKDRDEIGRQWAEERIARAKADGRPRSFETWMVTLLADDSDQVRVHAQNLEHRRTAELELRHPSEPDSIAFTVAVEAGGSRLTRRPLVVEGGIDLAHIRSGKLKAPQVECSVRHRYLLGRMSAAVLAAPPDELTIEFELAARGRGLVMFPLSVVALPLFKKVAKRQLEKAVRDLPANVEKLNREIERRFGTPPSPDVMAASLLPDVLREVVATLPTS